MAETTAKKPATGGRKSLFKPEYVEQARKLALLGAIDREIAEFFGITDRGFRKWKLAHPELMEALTVGKEVADNRVERSLYQRAVGYSHNAVKVMHHKGVPVVIPYTEHMAPDVVACIFWLKNRRRSEWLDKFDHEHRGGLEVRGAVNLTDEQLAELATAVRAECP